MVETTKIQITGSNYRRGWVNPPAVVWIPATLAAIGMVLPLVYLVLRTIGIGSEVVELLFRSRTLEIMLRSLLLTFAVSSVAVLIAVPIAWLTVRTDLPLRRLFLVITVLPLVIPSYVGGFVVVAVLGPKGLVQGWVAPFGVDRLPEIFGFPGALLTLSLLTYPYVLLPVRAALSRLDPALEETSYSLGKGRLYTAIHVTFPMLRPSIVGGALLVSLYTLSDFGAVSLLHYETFTWAIYVQYGNFARDMAAALSLVLVAFAVGLVIIESKTRSRSQYFRGGTGVARTPMLIKLGALRWPALIICFTVILLALVMPLSVLIYWVIRGMYYGEQISLLWGQLANSIYVSGLAALITVVTALPITILSVRYPGHLSSLLERFSYVGFALPGIVVALALVFFGIRYITPLYQTMFLLIFAYIVLFLPTAIATTRASLIQVSPALEEAARSLGRSHFRVLTSITFPLLRPGMLAGIIMVFMLTMKELPATLILSPIGFKTLATSVWWATEDGFFTQAAVPALGLILVSIFPMAFLILFEKRFQD